METSTPKGVRVETRNKMQQKAFLSLLLLVQSERGLPPAIRIPRNHGSGGEGRRKRAGVAADVTGSNFLLILFWPRNLGGRRRGSRVCVFSLSSQGQTLSLHRRCFYLRRGVCQGEWRGGGGGSKKDHSSPSLSGLVRRRIANSIVGHQQYI